MITVIASMILSADKLRQALKRPSPELYEIATGEALTALFEDISTDELTLAVKRLQRCPVHPQTPRIGLIETLNTHFQHMVNHRKNPATGQPYSEK